ncbi:unnamed protein product [Prunus brigantina]
MPSGGQMNPPIIPKVIVFGDDEGSSTVEKEEVEGKGCRKKRPAQRLLHPFTDPSRKKRTMSVLDAEATSPYFDPTKPLPIEDVKAVIQFCTAWKNDIRLGFFTLEIQSSCYCSMQLYTNKKITKLSVGSAVRTHWTTADYCLQQFIEPVKGPTKKRGLNKAAASNTVDLPLSNLNNTHHYVHGTDTLARVLYDMHFYDAFEVEQVKQKGMKMSTFMPFTVCNIGDVPQQRDGTSCGIMTVKFIEHLSVSISLDKVDPSKIKYYLLKLAIEVFYEDANIKALLERVWHQADVGREARFVTDSEGESRSGLVRGIAKGITRRARKGGGEVHQDQPHSSS